MARVLGVGGVFFKSPDPRRLYEWYGKWLGLRVMEEGGGTFAVFWPHGMPKNGYTVWSVFEASTKYFSPGDKPYMFNLVVDNLVEALEQVAAGGAKVVGEGEMTEFGKFGWFIDPDGNKVELWEPPP